MKKALFALCLAAISSGAMATDVPHHLTGSVIVNKIPSTPLETKEITYNVRMDSHDLCTDAISAIEHATFSPYAQVTKGGKAKETSRSLCSFSACQ